MKKLILIVAALLVLACGLPTAISPTPAMESTPTAPAETLPSLEPTPIPTQAPPQATETAAPHPVEPTLAPTVTVAGRSETTMILPYNENIMINYATNACKAAWSNNLAFLPCPGEISGTDGVVVFMDQPVLSNGMTVVNHTLLTVPGYGSNGGGIFGRYPAYTVDHEKTHFMAGLTCLNFPCRADFGLGYYDQNGVYADLVTWPLNSEIFSEEYGHIVEVDYDLAPFLNQTIELVLVVRNPTDAPNTRQDALWVEPMIYLKY